MQYGFYTTQDYHGSQRCQALIHVLWSFPLVGDFAVINTTGIEPLELPENKYNNLRFCTNTQSIKLKLESNCIWAYEAQHHLSVAHFWVRTRDRHFFYPKTGWIKMANSLELSAMDVTRHENLNSFKAADFTMILRLTNRKHLRLAPCTVCIENSHIDTHLPIYTKP